MLFLGLGTGLGSAMVVDGTIVPLELAHLSIGKKTFEDDLGLRGLERLGRKRWEEFKKIGVKYSFMRSARENDWYPHYIHNLDNFIRFGGLFPPIHVQADIRRTRLLGVTHAPHEGGCLMVRSRDDIYRMCELKGRKIGLSKSLTSPLRPQSSFHQPHRGTIILVFNDGIFV